jgi:PAS domain S-box-containing protein
MSDPDTAFVPGMFREIFMNAPEAMWLVDDERRYCEINQAACAMLGTARQAILGKQLDDFADEAHRRALPALWKRFLNGKDVSGEFRFVSTRGDIVITSFLARADVVPGLHLGMFRETSRQPTRVVSAA